MKAMKTLIVEDDFTSRLLLQELLKGYGPSHVAVNGKEAVEATRLALEAGEPYDLICLDIMMPEMDGMQTCSVLKKIPALSDTLIVFLSARGEDYSQISGFEAGADDYITKPVRPKVFLSRVQALLRRYRPSEPVPDIMVMDEFTIDREKYLVVKDGMEIVLPRKEFELLFLLVSSPNKVFTRNEIFLSVWGDDVIVGDRTIDVHIRRIRERLRTDNIRTLKGVGYKYEMK